MNGSYDLSLEEQKIILTLASMTSPTDEEFKPYKFKIADFMALLGVENKAKYTEIPKITKELMKKVFEIHEGKKILQVAWLSSVEYEKGSGMVELEFSPKLKPYMLKLNTMFTQYQLANILSMKSKYSPRIYEILKCNDGLLKSNPFKKKDFIEVELEELRQLLKAEDIYPRYYDFRRYILETTQKELKKNSDISFDFEENRIGRRVTSIKFYINNNQAQKVNAPNPKQADEEVVADRETPLDIIENDIKLIMGFTENQFTEKNAVIFRSESKGDIELIRKVYKYMKCELASGKKIPKKVGYIITLLRNFDEPQELEKVGIDYKGFNNFEPRDYDYDTLEKKLLGWYNEEEN